MSTTNYNSVTDNTFSTIAIGDLFDQINTTIKEQLSVNKDHLVNEALNTARIKASS